MPIINHIKTLVKVLYWNITGRFVNNNIGKT
jgi:hypothetical protein